MPPPIALTATMVSSRKPPGFRRRRRACTIGLLCRRERRRLANPKGFEARLWAARRFLFLFFAAIFDLLLWGFAPSPRSSSGGLPRLAERRFRFTVLRFP